MSKTKSTKRRAFSPSRAVWRTQMDKGKYLPHRVSRITCIVNTFLSDRISEFLKELGTTVYIENSRTVREYIKSVPLAFMGKAVKLRDFSAVMFRFTVPRQNATEVMNCIIDIAELHIPGRGTVFSQDLMEFCEDSPAVDLDFLKSLKVADHTDMLINKLAYVMCILPGQGSGENLAKVALELGVCVPVVTIGYGSDTRDKLGLVRVTIPPEKEIVHLVMPEQDSDSIARLLIEQGRLNRPGSGFIVETPVTAGLLDTHLKTGKQEHAATIEQIIAAIDQLKSDTNWRKRLDAQSYRVSSNRFIVPQDNCEISIISDEDRIDKLKEVCMKHGAPGATSSFLTPQVPKREKEITATMIRVTISVPSELTDTITDALLEVSSIGEDKKDRIHILDSPAAYIHTIQ